MFEWVEYIHEKIRRLFGYTLTSIRVMTGEEFKAAVNSDTIAAVGQGETMINSDWFPVAEAAGYTPAILVEQVDVHEQGHVYSPYDAPGCFASKVRDVKAVKKNVGISTRGIHTLLNIVYDSEIDVANWDRGIYDPRPLMACFAHKEPTCPDSNIGQYLVAFREEALGDRFSGWELATEVREVARKVVKIIRKPLYTSLDGVYYDSQSVKTLEISKLLASLFSQDDPPEDPDEGDNGENGKGGAKPGKPGKKGKPTQGKKKPSPSGGLTPEEKKALEKALEEAMEEGQIGEAKSAEEAEGDLDAALKDIDLKDPETADIVKDLLKLSSTEMQFRQVWADAEKAIRFEMNLRGSADGENMRACDMPWRVGEPLRNLDIQASMQKTGMFIPGVTTVQGHYVPGPGIPLPEVFPRMIISADCSGSMETSTPYPNGRGHDLVCAAIFALIHEAKKKKAPVGVNLFGATNKYFEPTRQYERLAREVYAWVDHVGGGNEVGGLEPLRGMLHNGDLLVYVTDFHLFAHCKSAKEDLERFAASGVEIAFIAMFKNHNGTATGLAYSECKNLKDLQGIALRSARSKAGY